MNFRLLPAAIDDLERIDEWIIERFGERSADKARDKLVHLFHLLVEQPYIGSVRQEYAAEPMRFYLSGPNWIVYRVGDPLLIYRVYPASMEMTTKKLRI